MLTFAILTAITIGLVQVIKKAGMPHNFAPLVAVVFGIISNFVANGLSGETFIIGIAIGLSASGLFDQTKLLKRNGKDILPQV